MNKDKSKVKDNSVIEKKSISFISQLFDGNGFDFLKDKRWQYVMLFFLAFIWGSSFILMKKGLQSFNAGQVAGLRIFLTFLFYIPFIINRYRKLNKGNLLFILIVGFIGNAFPAILFTLGQTELSSSLAGILNSLVPLFTLFIGFLFFKSKTAWKNILGIIIGLSGTIGLIYNGQEQFATGNLWYSLFIILATIFYSISANIIKEKLRGLDGLTIATLSFLVVGPFAGIYLCFTDLEYAFSTPNALENFKYIVFLALFSSFLAVALFNMLIKYTSTIFATSVTYIIPVFAILWGVLDNETISFIQILFMFTILIGIYLVNKRVS